MNLNGFSQKQVIDVLKKNKIWKECIPINKKIYWICSHGISHIIWAPKRYGKTGYVHNCDGCCKKIK